jgi:hypothetical protein
VTRLGRVEAEGAATFDSATMLFGQKGLDEARQPGVPGWRAEANNALFASFRRKRIAVRQMVRS